MTTLRRPRPAARLFVIGPDDRLLLFRFVYRSGPQAGFSFWATPGGALDPGESFQQAARRELYEETGHDVAIGPQVYARINDFDLPDGTPVRAEERFFLVKLDHHRIAGDNPDAFESEMIAGWRWWSAPELVETAETVFPEELAELMPGLVARRA
ncbi:NUDIX domain-containing protein [Nitratireductor mangrovi]|uniref:NUDIX domain-containing protein n=1 Tax=Nitratireductor mangrovi TaxID=2599600 RepID=A0A5B8L1J7_9HYPH|nr:NUDIX domain-containing protein [Nitratireductor mangrovi]QDZ01825.1 NUDIX domain-containing protein [Nitratireductor mangrovi]